MLDFSQVRNGKFHKATSRFQLAEAVQEIVNVLKFKAESMGIEVQVTLNIPSAQLYVRTDRHRLQQIILNLLSNALKFT